MRGLVLAAIVLLAFACNGGGEGLPAATPGPSPSATPVATATPSPTPTATASPVPSPTGTPTVAPTAALEIAYVGSDERDIWLVAADGGSRRNLTQGRCPRLRGPYWSPKGDRIACIATGSAAIPHTQVLVFDLEGRLILQIEHAAGSAGLSWPDMSGASPSSLWSPDGRFLAYVVVEAPLGKEGMREEHTPVLYVAHSSRGILTSMPNRQQPRWSPDGSRLAYNRPPGETLVVYDLATGREEALGEDMRPLAWVLGGKALLVAADYESGLSMFPTYSANLLDLATGELKRMPQLDNSAQFWPSPDGRSVAVFTHQAGAEIALLDLTTGAVIPIPGAVPYDREWMPPDHVAFSSDGSQLFWADFLPVSNEGVYSVAIYRADTDGSGNATVGQIESVQIRFSPDLTKVLYRRAVPSMENPLWVANVDGSEARLLAEDAGPAAWRPLGSRGEPGPR